ncbi:MAG: hypothetical protein GXP29_02500, partial [Planctomycetes bacterium]|nr:hypothetical protein [Planctomycetota bacterium]
LDPCDDGVLGAWCRYDGTCEDGVEKFDCETPLLGQTPGIWQGQGTSCDVQTCDVLGACCEDPLTCDDVAIENCTTEFFTWTEGQPCLYDPCAATVGACCVFGECQILNSFDCAAAGGVFEDVGTNGHRACELAAPCTNGQQGACCLPGGNCEVLTPAECASSNGVYDGDGVSCASLQCVVGTCCDLGDVCTEERQVDCLGLGSAPGEPGSSCSGTAANPCIPSGACCFDDATCSVLNETILAPQCSSMGGTYQGDGTVCEAIACPEVGACCSELVPDSGFFGCENGVSEPVCLARPLGSFGGFGSDCTGNPCGQGACCALDATCTDTSRLACEVDPLDDFLGNGTSCGVDVCEPRGACCMGTSCQILTQDICSNGAGMYLGDATICETNTCETAPCCVDGQCQDLFPTDCVATNGVQGTLGDACANGDFCTDGACCLGLSCFTAAGLHQLQCESLSGAFVGPGSDCSGDPCAPVTVGCCVPGGACQDLTEAGCLGVGGVSLGTDSDCATSDGFCSAEVGACCRPGDVCFADDTPANCAAQSGTFLGVGIDCSGNPCAVIGACCKLDGDCFDSGTQSQCDAIGGATFSSGQTCGAVSCPDVCSNGTLADFDNDGDADLQDYAELQICMGGPTVANPTIDDRCYCAFDVDTNGVFDQSDADVILPLFDGCLPFASQINGDFDNDGDVDLIDFASMQECVASGGVGPDPLACRCIFDDDGNGTVDGADVSKFGTMDGP